MGTTPKCAVPLELGGRFENRVLTEADANQSGLLETRSVRALLVCARSGGWLRSSYAQNKLFLAIEVRVERKLLAVLLQRAGFGHTLLVRNRGRPDLNGLIVTIR